MHCKHHKNRRHTIRTVPGNVRKCAAYYEVLRWRGDVNIWFTHNTIDKLIVHLNSFLITGTAVWAQLSKGQLQQESG
ncbi:hypothetical protein IWX85_004017 [Polaromonas sp. CG_9.11]|nr:hypothetical protein [Polaromonas sp. CG_9.11]